MVDHFYMYYRIITPINWEFGINQGQVYAIDHEWVCNTRTGDLIQCWYRGIYLDKPNYCKVIALWCPTSQRWCQLLLTALQTSEGGKVEQVTTDRCSPGVSSCFYLTILYLHSVSPSTYIRSWFLLITGLLGIWYLYLLLYNTRVIRHIVWTT